MDAPAFSYKGGPGIYESCGNTEAPKALFFYGSPPHPTSHIPKLYNEGPNSKPHMLAPKGQTIKINLPGKSRRREEKAEAGTCCSGSIFNVTAS